MNLLDLKESIFDIREQIVSVKGGSSEEVQKIRQEMKSISVECAGSLNYLRMYFTVELGVSETS